jgi:hypothetical protein
LKRPRLLEILGLFVYLGCNQSADRIDRMEGVDRVEKIFSLTGIYRNYGNNIINRCPEQLPLDLKFPLTGIGCHNFE